MLDDWIAPTSLDTFLATNLRRAPYASAGLAFDAARRLSWRSLEHVLACDPDVIVCARGDRLSLPAPRTLVELAALFARGVGLCVRSVERHDTELAQIAAALTDDLPGQAQVQLFVTPRGTHGFGWHWDAEDVFIIQCAGEKEYYFRDNTVDRDGDFQRFHEERSPIMTAHLVPGDFLYLPATWWHMAVCREPSLSISIGLRPADCPPIAAPRASRI
jgi:50S ribosomal protein L16 3-hydroxylase